jgi:hypothetical protein
MEQILHEYNRQKCYNFILKKLTYLMNIRHKRLQYEHKNIIERFILELINDGINSDDVFNNKLLFFNKTLTSIEGISQHTIFHKLMSEYEEKGFKLSLPLCNQIAQIFVSAHHYFLNIHVHVSKEQPQCKIKIYTDQVILYYHDYLKCVSKERYNMLTTQINIPCALFKMILRYSIFDNSGQHWSIGDDIYSLMVDDFSISLEMFASPLNYTIPRYCSLFIDTDKPFGSIGSFMNLTSNIIIKENIHGALFNPPYLPMFMNYTTKKLLNILTECAAQQYSMYIIAFLPAWYDSEFMNLLNVSPFLVINKLIYRGDYFLKQRHDDSVMVSNFDISLVVLQSNITHILEHKERDIQRIDKIIKRMKQEVKGNLIDHSV